MSKNLVKLVNKLCTFLPSYCQHKFGAPMKQAHSREALWFSPLRTALYLRPMYLGSDILSSIKNRSWTNHAKLYQSTLWHFLVMLKSLDTNNKSFGCPWQWNRKSIQSSKVRQTWRQLCSKPQSIFCCQRLVAFSDVAFFCLLDKPWIILIIGHIIKLVNPNRQFGVIYFGKETNLTYLI